MDIRHIIKHRRPRRDFLRPCEGYFVHNLTDAEIQALCLFVFCDTNSRCTPLKHVNRTGRLGFPAVVVDIYSGGLPFAIGWNDEGRPSKSLFMRVDLANFVIFQAWPV